MDSGILITADTVIAIGASVLVSVVVTSYRLGKVTQQVEENRRRLEDLTEDRDRYALKEIVDQDRKNVRERFKELRTVLSRLEDKLS